VGGKKDNKRNKKREEKKPRFKKKRKRACPFCVGKSFNLDYKNIEALRRFITDRGKIAPRRMTGCCAKHQRLVAQVIKRSRHAALLPNVLD